MQTKQDAASINEKAFDQVWSSAYVHKQRFQLNLELARKAFRQAVRKLALPKTDLVVADVGFGNGMLMFEFPRSATLLGTELSERALALARTRAVAKGYAKFSFLRPDGERLPFASRSADLVIASHVIEHVDDDLGLLAEMIRVLKSDAYLVLIFPLDATQDHLLSEAELVNPSHAHGHFHVRNYNLPTFLARLSHLSARVVTTSVDMHIWDWKAALDPRRERLKTMFAGKLIDRVIAALLNVPVAILPYPAYRLVDSSFRRSGYRPRQATVVLQKTADA